MECSRGERLSITLAKNRINRAPERVGKAKVEVDIFELLRDSEYETAETSTCISRDGVGRDPPWVGRDPPRCRVSEVLILVLSHLEASLSSLASGHSLAL